VDLGVDRALDSFRIYKGNKLCNDIFSYWWNQGGSEKINKFQRSFNMGLSQAFEASKALKYTSWRRSGPIDTALELGFKTKLFPNAYVYHKRRIEWDKFSVQVNKFGKVRPVLNSWYQNIISLASFPSVFTLGLLWPYY
jgi:hypothetical protein